MLSQKAHDGAPLRPYLRNRDVRWGGFDLSDLPTMAFDGREIEKFALRTGDLLVCEGGEVGRAAIWRDQMPNVYFQKALHRVRCSEQILSEFLFYLLMHYSMEHRFEKHVTGTTIDHLPQEDLRALEIPLPSITEQRAIVAAIERLFSRLDAAAATLRRLLHRADQLAEASYAAALDARCAQAKLQDVARTSSGGTPSRRKRQYYGGEIHWVKSGELRDGLVRDTEECITAEGLRSTSARLLRRGTLLMAMYGATIGKIGVLDLDEAATNQAVCAIEPFDPLFAPYLRVCLRALRRRLIELGQGGAQPNISQQIIKNLHVPVPPQEWRDRIVPLVERNAGLAQHVRVCIERGLRQTVALRRSILAHAFSGSLADLEAA